MYNVSRNRSYADLRSTGPSTLSDEEDDPNDHERDEDATARFDLHRRRSTNTVPSDHASALQRVKSLTERNRMVSPKRTDKVGRILTGHFNTLQCPHILLDSR
jgi:hypothetical protein